jgi:membrane associated rhomboid family serine protease
MVKPLSDPTPRIRIVRLAVVLACWIMLLTELSQAIERVFGLSPDFPWDARFNRTFVGGGSVFFILVTTFLIRQGRLRWFAKK